MSLLLITDEQINLFEPQHENIPLFIIQGSKHIGCFFMDLA